MTAPLFQHRHYEAIARVLKQRATHPSYADEAVKYVYDFAETFAVDNAKFNPDRFLRACGVEQ